MSRKDYIALAGAISEGRQDALDKGLQVASLASTATRIACVLQADNPRFDWNRFMVATGFIPPTTEGV